ncbi:hypothetical protein [Mangrovibacter phragmitis]|uniref:hypothetical protein n=1 Tax=Mangrovibacter phragmitis TaxID=1691903 RepID=UPI003369D1E1
MAKPDWGELQQRFLSDHARNGISPKLWCEAQGLNYTSARRYIKLPAQKSAQKKVRSAQSKKSDKSKGKSKPPKICADKKSANPQGAKRAPYNARPGNQNAVKHGGYGRRLLLSDATTEDSLAINLDDELFWLRAANLTAAENIGRWRTELEDYPSDASDEANRQARKFLLDNISSAEKAMHRNTARIESLECTKAAIAKLQAETTYREAVENKTRFDHGQEQSISELELERRKLANERLKAEILAIQNGGNDSTVIVHGGLNVPGGE